MRPLQSHPNPQRVMCRSPWYGSNLQIQGKTQLRNPPEIVGHFYHPLTQNCPNIPKPHVDDMRQLKRDKYPCGEIVFYHGTQYGVPFDLALPPPGHPHRGGVDHMLTHVFIYVIAN